MFSKITDRQDSGIEQSEFHVTIAQWTSEILGVIIFVFGCLIMAAWVLNPMIVIFFSPDKLITKFNVALCFCLIGLAIWCLQYKRMGNKWLRLTALLSAVALFIIALTTVSEYTFQCILGIDQLFYKVPADYVGNSIPGRMSFNSAICFALIGVSLLFSNNKKSSFIYVVHSLLLLIGAFSLLSLIGFCYGAQPFYIGPHFSTAMTLLSSILFPLSCMGIVFLRPDQGLTAQATSSFMGGRILRQLLPIGIITPILMGYIKLLSQRAFHLSNEFSVELVALGNLAAITLYILFLSILLNRSDAKRKKLDEERSRLLDIVEESPDFIGIASMEGVIQYTNKAGRKMVGFPPKGDIPEIKIQEAHPQWAWKILEQEGILASLSQGSWRGESVLLDRKGKLIPVLQSIVIHRDAHGQPKFISTIMSDITARKQMEDDLRKTQDRIKAITDSAQDAVMMIDPQGNICFWNPAAQRILGYSSEEIMGKNLHHLLMPTRYMSAFETAFPEYQKTGTGNAVGKIRELAAIRKDGTEIIVELSLSAIHREDGWHSMGILRDITENKKVERDLIQYKDHLEELVSKRTKLLEASEERYRHITLAITDYIYTIFIENGKPTRSSLNPAKLAITGYSAEDFYNEPLLWDKIIVEQDRPLVDRQIEDVLSGKKDVKPIEYRLSRKGGEICWISKSLLPQYDAQGKLFAIYVIIANITERKKTEDALNEAKEVAEQALAVRDEFTSTVSHELRTPLASIKSSIDILDTEVPGVLTPDQRIFIKRVKSNIDRLARLINDVLDLSKLEAGKMMMNFMPLRAESIIREVVESQEALVKSKGLTISTEFGENLPTLIADKDRLFQVLNNLINNALKFTQVGGIVVAVHSEDKQSITFSVQDTGVGIKEEDLNKLFKKFQQVGGASQQVAGTGLGLAICKMIIGKHNGRIWVESQHGRGSSFCFNIPVRKEKRILIVDDDEMTLNLLKSILEVEEIYEIEIATDGFRAGHKFYDFSPQLIILDINLPKINGLEVCKKIKGDNKTKNTKIIMISSFDSEIKKQEAWDAGADEIVNKPINSEELMAKVRKLI